MCQPSPLPAWPGATSPLQEEGRGCPGCVFCRWTGAFRRLLSYSALVQSLWRSSCLCAPLLGGHHVCYLAKASGCPDLSGSVPCIALSREELDALFLSYDLKRLEMYSRNMVDYHLIMDLIPAISRLYFLNQLGDLSLSAAQSVGYVLLV